MAKIKSGSAFASTTIDRFGGICSHADSLQPGAAEVVNFRIRGDGSLEKRSGWALKRAFPATIRAFWQGSINNRAYLFAVAASSVYRVDEETLELTQIRTLTTSSGQIQFLPYLDTLLLLDGAGLYYYSESQETFVKSFGYVPLLGKDWHPTMGGEPYEAPNLLNDYYRVSYENPGGYEKFYLPCPALLVRVWLNGNEIYDHQYTEGASYVTIPGGTAGSVSILALASSSISQPRIHTATVAALFEDGRHDALLLGGGGCGYRVFVSAPVSDASHAEAQTYLSSSDRLYLPSDAILLLGDGTHPITKLCKYHGRVVAFNDQSAWSIGFSDGQSHLPEVLPVRNALGCDEGGSVLGVDDMLFVNNQNGVWSVRASVTNPEEWSLCEHALPLREQLSELFSGTRCAAWVPEHREIWLRNTSNSRGRVWVYAIDRNEWYAFDNIFALNFIRFSGKLAFFQYTNLCTLEEGQSTDHGSVPIRAYYQSTYLSLSRPDDVKRVLRVALDAGSQSEIGLTIQTDHTTSAVTLLPDGTGSAPQHYEARFHPGRFYAMRFRISADGSEQSRCYRIAFFANP